MSIYLERKDGLATLVFDNPEKMNILGWDEVGVLNRLTQEIADDRSIRVIVIRAEGKVFGAGGDIGSLHPGDTALPQAILEMGAQLNRALLRLYNSPAIVVTAVQGAVAGGSIGAMNVADLVIAAKGTRFNMGYANIGASPDAGSTWFMPRLVGARKASDWLLLSDNFDADTALAAGLITQVVPPEQLRDVTDKLAARLLHGPRETYAHIKKLLHQADTASLKQQLDDEIEACADVVASGDFAEGVAAFMAKRPARFGRSGK
ncbi:MAG: enoyl-CoA hydratase/isomerase family protein [Burkholderiales bacterium]|nr:enoyl-CoA hydratase/isomerase family protein [Burkholderiales bacterium]